jgi:hypothetical protein
MNDTAYPLPSETKTQYQIRTHWLPALLYGTAALVLVAIVRLVGM